MNQSNPIEYVCKHCNQRKGKHRAHALQCPIYIGKFVSEWSTTTIYYPEQYQEGVEVKE